MIPEITIKISIAPEEVIISKGQITEGEVAVPPVPSSSEDVQVMTRGEVSLPPVPSAPEDVQVITEVEATVQPPPGEESLIYDVDISGVPEVPSL